MTTLVYILEDFKQTLLFIINIGSAIPVYRLAGSDGFGNYTNGFV